jgi:quinol monooxygenase YgiN
MRLASGAPRNEVVMVGCPDMGRVGRYVELKAREGQRHELVAHMLGAAHLLADVPGCELYVINTSATDSDTVWVTEVWRTQAELDASLTNESVKASVEQVVPLLAGPPERIDILPVGGIGLDGR